MLLTKYLRAGISYDRLQRIERFPVPEAALREAIINAVVHKDYGAANPIQISVYDDRVMFWNPGLLPEDWTLKDLTTKHSSRPFNPDIAHAFFRTSYLESWGRGIELMTQACNDYNCPELKLRWDSGLWVEFPFHPAGGKDAPVKTVEETVEEPREKTREIALRLIAENPAISMDDIAVALGISRRGVEWQVSKLRSEGVLRRIGPTKGGHWEVTDPATGEAPEEVTEEVTEEVGRLLQVMNGQMRRIEIQEELGLRHEVHFREVYLVPALKAGFIEMTVPEKPNSRLQKYRLTSTGALLQTSFRRGLR